MPPKKFRLIHLLGIIHVHVHQVEYMKCGCKIVLHPLKRKKRVNNIHALSNKKNEKERKKGEVCSAIHETTMDCILIYHLHLTHEMNI